MSKYEKNFGNIKINFKGKVSSQKIIEDLASVLITLQRNFDIEEFSGVNFIVIFIKMMSHKEFFQIMTWIGQSPVLL